MPRPDQAPTRGELDEAEQTLRLLALHRFFDRLFGGDNRRSLIVDSVMALIKERLGSQDEELLSRNDARFISDMLPEDVSATVERRQITDTISGMITLLNYPDQSLEQGFFSLTGCILAASTAHGSVAATVSTPSGVEDIQALVHAAKSGDNPFGSLITLVGSALPPEAGRFVEAFGGLLDSLFKDGPKGPRS